GAQITSSLEVGNAFDIGVDPGRYVYLTSMTQGNPLTVLQGKEKTGTVTLNGPSGAVDVLTTTHHAYIALRNAGQVAVVSGTTVINPGITVGITPTAVVANPGNGLVYVANFGSDNVTIINSQSFEPFPLSVGNRPAALALDLQRGYLYVANSGDDTVSVIQNNTVISTVNVGTSPVDIAVDPETGYAYVVNAGYIGDPGSLSVLSGTHFITTTTVGEYPKAVDVNPRTGYVYVVGGQGSTGTVSVLTRTLVVETFLPVGHAPRDVVVDPATDLGYVSLYKASGGTDIGRIVILGRTEASYIDIDPDVPSPYQLDCEGLNGIAITLLIPTNAVDEETRLLCAAWEPDTGPRYAFAGQGFLLKAYQNAQHQPGFTFLKPITVSIPYQTTLPADVEEAELEMRVGASGENLWQTNGILTQRIDMEEKVFTATLNILPDQAQKGYAL
ncbi:MAG: YncE family protein, partial [Anaerolineae bacterium]